MEAAKNPRSIERFRELRDLLDERGVFRQRANGSFQAPAAAWYFATRSAGTRPRSLMS